MPKISLANDEPPLAIIVHPEHNVKLLNKSELSLIFWRKKLYWPNGKRIQPVNFPVESPLRLQFSKRVLNSLPETQTDYWNGLYYHGISPPHVVHSNEAMLRFVTEIEGSIGYVPACLVDSRAKVLGWVDNAGNLLTEAPECK